jgi:hypothetical protein
MKVNVLKRGSLSNLPINSTDTCILIGACDISFEIAKAAEEVVGNDIPFLLVSDIHI